MKNNKDNFWNWDLKIEYSKLTNNDYFLSYEIDEINKAAFYFKKAGNTLCGIGKSDLILFDSYFHFLDFTK